MSRACGVAWSLRGRLAEAVVYLTLVVRPPARRLVVARVVAPVVAAVFVMFVAPRHRGKVLADRASHQHRDCRRWVAGADQQHETYAQDAAHRGVALRR